MKKLLKWLVILVVLLFAGCTIGYLAVNEKLPTGTPGPEADALAQKVLDRLNHNGWQQTAWVAWDFDQRQQYVWHRSKNRVEVSWKKNRVLLQLQNPEQSVAFRKGERLSTEVAQPLIEKALRNFNNDSFWFIAPFKLFDVGSQRALVPNKAGGNDLLITYTKGGSTPGDSYLWQLDAEGQPLSYRMWVSIIPIGGLKATWESWENLSSGARVATRHQFAGMLPIKILNLRSGDTYQDLDLKEDPFAALAE